MATCAAVTGSAPAWVRDRLAGTCHAGTILHVGTDALYVRSDGDAIGVLSRHASPVPCAVATRLDRLDGALGDALPRVGDPVGIGGGRISLGAAAVRVTRIVDVRLAPIETGAAAPMRERLARAAGDLDTRCELDAASQAGLRRRPDHAVEAVLGRGSGLTPFGDDVVCGLLATLVAADDPCAPGLRESTLRLAPTRTGALSATLLRRAAAGEVLPAFAAAARDLARHPENAPATVARVRSVGHTSGLGLLVGLGLALDHLVARSCR